ncbi:MAG: beta-N-acetylglucosaminidase domain-containing protein [Melioribacteraceae bacterium]|nr:beta-N-acetylglucosaminidase domain-containing protein [Melioribacteraceae bacterium]
MRNKKAYILLLIFVLPLIAAAQNDPARPAPIDERLRSDSIRFVWVENKTADIYPTPQTVKYSNNYFELFDSGEKPKAAIIYSNKSEERAAKVFNRQLQIFNLGYVPVLKKGSKLREGVEIKIVLNSNLAELKDKGDQAYTIRWKKENEVIVYVAGTDLKGLIYGITSLAQLVVRRNNKVVLREADVTDHPKFTRRMFNSKPFPNHIQNDLDWMIRYKIETISFHNKDYSWDNIDDELSENMIEYSKWSKEFGGVEGLLLLNLYKGKSIEISNVGDINKIKKIISTAYQKGIGRVMILADDTPPFKFGEGYVLPSENDRKKFSTMAEAHSYLMNEIVIWSKKTKYKIEFYYCPSFYTYEEMHYGDMKLYLDTPWENDAYIPLKRDLRIIGKKMHKDVFIMWTGPFVCTRTITDNDLIDWTNNLQSRAPFLFDNSIFSQLEFTARTMFTPYQNDFPENFELKTGGNGIFINGDGTGETSRASTMTANAYMWEGDSYKPNISLIEAMKKLYGENAISTLMKYKETELELNKKIKEREIWFAADELWKSIRNTRFITEKNPFYYHLNYGRFKALRLQLKYSVPEPEPIESFISNCINLDKRRWDLLKEIEKLSFIRLSYALQMEMVQLPDFNKK